MCVCVYIYIDLYISAHMYIYIYTCNVFAVCQMIPCSSGVQISSSGRRAIIICGCLRGPFTRDRTLRFSKLPPPSWRNAGGGSRGPAPRTVELVGLLGS